MPETVHGTITINCLTVFNRSQKSLHPKTLFFNPPTQKKASGSGGLFQPKPTCKKQPRLRHLVPGRHGAARPFRRASTLSGPSRCPHPAPPVATPTSTAIPAAHNWTIRLPASMCDTIRRTRQPARAMHPPWMKRSPSSCRAWGAS